MYLKGSKWTMLKRRKRPNPWRIIILALLVGAALYFNQVIVPATPPLFIPTPTPTRDPESYFDEGELLYDEGMLDQAIAAYEHAAAALPEDNIALYRLVRLMVLRGRTHQERPCIAIRNKL